MYKYKYVHKYFYYKDIGKVYMCKEICKKKFKFNDCTFAVLMYVRKCFTETFCGESTRQFVLTRKTLKINLEFPNPSACCIQSLHLSMNIRQQDILSGT